MCIHVGILWGVRVHEMKATDHLVQSNVMCPYVCIVYFLAVYKVEFEVGRTKSFIFQIWDEIISKKVKKIIHYILWIKIIFLRLI